MGWLTYIFYLPIIAYLATVRLCLSLLSPLWRRHYNKSPGQPRRLFARQVVVTEDGYPLNVDRLECAKSNRVAFLQHGLMDSSHSFLPLAHILHALDYDVYLGNFREANEGDKFTVDELAKYDMSAMMLHIQKTRGSEPFTVTIVAHSLGGAAVMMHLVMCKLGLAKCHVWPTSVVLLSPAGLHVHNTPLFNCIVSLLYVALTLVPAVGTFPSMLVGNLIGDIVEDVRRIPPLRWLLGHGASLLLGGDPNSFHRIKIRNLCGGPSNWEMGRHLLQGWGRGKFQTYDNGQETPLNVIDKYHLIDCPVHWVAGDADLLILAENVKMQYAAHHAGQPSFAHYHLLPMSHLDYTQGNTTDLVKIINSDRSFQSLSMSMGHMDQRVVLPTKSLTVTDSTKM